MTTCTTSPTDNPCDLSPLEDDLGKLRRALIDAQRQQETAQIDIQQRGARITELQRLIAEFNTIIGRYRERFPQLKERQDNLKEHCDKETGCFKANLGEALAKNIEETSDAEFQKIEDRRKALAKHETDCATERTALAQLRQERDDALAKLNQLRQLDTEIEARHRSADTQRQAVQAERDAHRYNEAYYLLKGKGKFCQTVEGDPQVLTVEKLCERLKQAWTTYKEKDENFNKKDAEVQACDREVATLRTQLEQDEANLETLIRRKVAELRGAPAPTSSSSSSSSSSSW